MWGGRLLGSQEEEHRAQYILTVGGEKDFYPTFKNYVHSVRTSENYSCDCPCGQVNVEHEEEVKITILEECKYLMVKMGAFTSGNINGINHVFRRDRRIQNPLWREELFGVSFKLIAAIHHMRNNPECDHYIACLASIPTRTAGKRLIIERENIIKADVEIVVNAANARLIHGGGLDHVIRSAYGSLLIDTETDQLRKTLPGGQLAQGQIVSTGSYNLNRFKKIFHTAAPYINLGRQPTPAEEAHLRFCYFNALSSADLDGFRSIAFPLLGIGIYNFDEKKGTAAALQAIFSYFEIFPNTNLETVRIVALSKDIIGRMKAKLTDGIESIALDSGSIAKAKKILEENMKKT